MGKRKSSKPPPKKPTPKLDTVGVLDEACFDLFLAKPCGALLAVLPCEASLLLLLPLFASQMFNCPFCNSSKSVSCTIDHDKELAFMHCSQCPMKFECRITHLTEPIDVSSHACSGRAKGMYAWQKYLSRSNMQGDFSGGHCSELMHCNLKQRAVQGQHAAERGTCKQP